MKTIFDGFLKTLIVTLSASSRQEELKYHSEEPCSRCGAKNAGPKTHHWHGCRKLFFFIETNVFCREVRCSSCYTITRHCELKRN